MGEPAPERDASLAPVSRLRITTALADGGAHVTAGYHRGQEAAERLQPDLTAQGRSVSIHHGNVRFTQ
jgi:hypothetical protein